MLYNPWPARRKKVLVAILAVLIAVLAAVIVFSIRQKKQKARQDGLNEQRTEAKSAEDKQKAMLEAINKTNSQTQPVSQEESAKRAQDMLNEMNKANKK